MEVLVSVAVLVAEVNVRVEDVVLNDVVIVVVLSTDWPWGE